MRSGMRMRTHRMREILLNADKDANAFDEIWEWMRTRILTKAFASMRFCVCLVLNLETQNMQILKKMTFLHVLFS